MENELHPRIISHANGTPAGVFALSVSLERMRIEQEDIQEVDSLGIYDPEEGE